MNSHFQYQQETLTRACEKAKPGATVTLRGFTADEMKRLAPRGWHYTAMRGQTNVYLLTKPK